MLNGINDKIIMRNSSANTYKHGVIIFRQNRNIFYLREKDYTREVRQKKKITATANMKKRHLAYLTMVQLYERQ